MNLDKGTIKKWLPRLLIPLILMVAYGMINQKDEVEAQSCMPIFPRLTNEVVITHNDFNGLTRRRLCSNSPSNVPLFTGMFVEDTDSSSEYSRCRIENNTSAGEWQLVAHTSWRCDDCAVQCRARCMMW